MELIDRLVGNPAVTIIVIAFVLALTDFITGVGRAIREKAFAIDALPLWLESHLLGRVLPIAATAVLGYAFFEPLYAIAGLGLATYVAETLASIRANLKVPTVG